MKIYGDGRSGNCYKLQLLMSLLGRDYEWVPVNILAGETQTEAFKQLNPNGKIPLLVTDEGDTLSESNAILNYLAEGSQLLPEDRWQRALVLQWQFFEQYSHEPFIAVARYINLYLGLPDDRRAEYVTKQEGGHRALVVMEQQLSQTPFLCGEQLTIADLSLYAYTHVAHEGGFDLTTYPAIRQWLQRIEQLPGYVPMRPDVFEQAE
ncbi:glutathione S-transferase family protein [Marinicella sediminis]|uniref:Glutathione S-transferase family protein n=1 Tax=Marinicella sediminis TaxID=1792834 RepID=A0ABV7J948_9GAMM|nr:glutathione S-transferase family protein [Marinicella sediminis]